jgi:Zn-dependent metalloprotease
MGEGREDLVSDALALNKTSNFKQMVDMSTQSASALFGPGSTEQKAVIKAWKSVGF